MSETDSNTSQQSDLQKKILARLVFALNYICFFFAILFLFQAAHTNRLYLYNGLLLSLLFFTCLLSLNKLSTLSQILLLSGAATPLIFAFQSPSFKLSFYFLGTSAFWMGFLAGLLPGLCLFFLGIWSFTIYDRYKLFRQEKKEMALAFLLIFTGFCLIFSLWFLPALNSYALVAAGLFVLPSSFLMISRRFFKRKINVP